MHENAIAGKVVDAAYQVHKRLGPGLLESIYTAALEVELSRKGLDYRTEVRVPVVYDGISLNLSFRVDLIVENSVLVEVKAVEARARVHRRQVLTYLRLTGLRLGLLVNFGLSTIKEGLSRVVNNLTDEDLTESPKGYREASGSRASGAAKGSREAG